ncbi:MAG: ThuA domain-containing protein [Anaerolineae bacterium]|nr:ThuA domain-containing protein [Anaerolineae bacterium]
MREKPRIVFLVGGAYHPAGEQAEAVCDWLGAGYDCVIRSGVAAFEALDEADLFVPMGSHFTGMTAPERGLTYEAPQASHRHAFERYVASGKPILVHHGAIVAYDDWPRFTELLGFRWVRGITHHPPVSEFRVRVKPTGHPVLDGVADYTIIDELYIDVQVMPGLTPEVHAAAYIPDDTLPQSNGHTFLREQPLVWTAEGGRVPGAGKVVYLANGHDMRAFAGPALQRLWLNAVRWLLT